MSLLVDQGVSEDTGSKLLRSTSVDLYRLGKIKIVCVIIDTKNVILWVSYAIPFGLSFFWYFLGIVFQLLSLAKDH